MIRVRVTLPHKKILYFVDVESELERQVLVQMIVQYWQHFKIYDVSINRSNLLIDRECHGSLVSRIYPNFEVVKALDV